MKVVTWEKSKDVKSGLGRLFRKPSFFLFSSFLAYNLLLGTLGILLIFAVTSPLWRQNFINKVWALSGLEGLVSSLNDHSGKTAPFQPSELAFTIDPQALQTLEGFRKAAAARGFLEEAEKQAFPATLQYEGQRYAVSISVDGHVPAPWEEGEPWFLEVRTEGGGKIMGLDHFSVRSPGEEDVLSRWLMDQMARKYGLSSAGYDLADLELNGQDKGLFVVRQKGVPTMPYRQDIREDEAGKVFDLKKTAVYFALIELWGGRSPAGFGQQRFIPDPETGLLAPLVSGDGQPVGVLSKIKLLATGRQLRLEHDAEPPGPLSWQEALFRNPVFFREYIAVLEQIALARPEELFPADLRGQLARRQELLRARQVAFDPGMQGRLEQNAYYIYQTLTPRKRVHAYFRSFSPSTRQVELDVVNIHHLPTQVLKASIGDSIDLKLASPSGLINACMSYQPAPERTLRFQLPDAVNWGDSLLAGLTVYAVTPGSSRSLAEAVTPYAASDASFLAVDALRVRPNAREFPFLQIDEKQKKILIKPGEHRMDKDMILPAGYEVIAGPGTRVDMTNGSNLISYSAFFFRGSREQPVVFYSSDSTAQGITVLQPGKESGLQFVVFENHGKPDRGGWILTSSINFYEAPVKLDRVTFRNNRIADDALNIIRSGFTMDSVVFSGTNADAFDSDFSNGIIRNTRFIRCGNDGLDISGSDITVENLEVDGAGDKGISIGERSRLKGRNIRIRGAEIAFAGKDLSDVRVRDIQIRDSKIAFCAFQKKPEYGPAVITVESGATITGRETINYLIEEGCTMTIAGEPVKSDMQISHVREILYGVKFGKASK